MTDREMLEKAAKAAGIDYHIDHLDCCAKLVAEGQIWNPLTDDGDALRLAVHLKFTISTWSENVGIWCGFVDISEPIIADDRLTATRRAIVRAAAAIGMKEDPCS